MHGEPEQVTWSPQCRNGFDIIQSQPLRSSFKLIISFTFSSLIFKSLGSERLDKFSKVLVEFKLLLFKAQASSLQRKEDHRSSILEVRT